MTAAVQETCDCSHPMAPHVLVVTDYDDIGPVENVPVAGVVLCPHCDCVVTWSVAGYPEPDMPLPVDVERVRQDIFGELPDAR